jgi:hypothetical protein|tara:strand:+ start:1620 stop:2333 length:714 start_codon:yes stop_codon:yes gene_type:complete
MQSTLKLFEDIFQDKSLAVVGPSPHLKGKKLGSYIDSFDLVIRVNEIVPNSLRNDYGKKNDIIFISVPNNSIEYYKNLFKQLSNELHDVKYFICPRNSLHVSPYHLGNFRDEENIFNNFSKLNTYHNLVHIGNNENDRLESEMGFHPSTGTLTLSFLTQFKYNHLYVAGFSFYKTKNRYNSKKARLMKKAYGRNINNAPAGHNQEIEIKYLQSKFEHLQNVSGDEWFVTSIIDKYQK